MFDWVVFDKGQARFCGGQRGSDDGGQDILAVQLENGRPCYGEFTTRYEAAKMHYNVEVLSFGYPDQLGVGSPVPTARQAFSRAEVDDIRALISTLMLADVPKPVPVKHKERFLGKIFFKEGWIREK